MNDELIIRVLDRIESKVDALSDEVSECRIRIERHDASDASVAKRLDAIESSLKPIQKTYTVAQGVLKIGAGCGVLVSIAAALQRIFYP